MHLTNTLHSGASEILLTILATSDVHASLVSYDYYADCAAIRPALSRVATLINTERTQAANSILLDNGDFLQGTPLSDLFSDHAPPEDMENPAIAAMNMLKYDAVALGNHEFNLAMPVLKKTLAKAQFPRLCANLVTTPAAGEDLQGMWQPHVILDRTCVDITGNDHIIRIGVFGVMPPQVLSWDRSRIGEKIVAHDIVTSARQSVQQLRADGADIIIALAHTGLSEAPAFDGMENAGLPLAEIDGIDAIVFGHSHLAFPGAGQPSHPAISIKDATIHGKPAVMPGVNGHYLGKIQLNLSKKSTCWTVSASKASLIDALAPSPGMDIPPENPEILALLQPAHDWILTQIRKPVGHTLQSMQSYFGLLPGSAANHLVAMAQASYVADQLQGTDYGDLPLLVASAPQKCGGRGGPGHFTDIPAGPIALSHITDLQFFPNDICALRLLGHEIADWLEMSASIYHQIQPNGGDQQLQNEDFPPYNSDTIYGLTYQIDLSQPARHLANGSVIDAARSRIRNLCFQGNPIDPNQEFVVAVNNYRAGGGGYFPHISPDRLIFDEPTKVRDLIIRYLNQTESKLRYQDMPWQFTPISGASGVFCTGRKAHLHLGTVPHLHLDALDTTADGFVRYRLNLQ